MCKVHSGNCGTSEIEHGLCACTVDNSLAKARRLSLRTGAQTMLCLSQIYPLSKSLVLLLLADYHAYATFVICFSKYAYMITTSLQDSSLKLNLRNIP